MTIKKREKNYKFNWFDGLINYVPNPAPTKR